MGNRFASGKEHRTSAGGLTMNGWTAEKIAYLEKQWRAYEVSRNKVAGAYQEVREAIDTGFKPEGADDGNERW